MIVCSAVAAQVLGDGRTAHSAFQVPIPFYQESTCTALVDSPLADGLRQTNPVIVYEIVMTKRYNLEAVNPTLRDITPSNLPFSGKATLLIGDFCQNPSRCVDVEQIANSWGVFRDVKTAFILQHTSSWRK